MARHALASGRRLVVGLSVSFFAAGSFEVRAQQAEEWRHYTGDQAVTKYSPLDQINRENVTELRVVWHRPAVDTRFTEAFPELTFSPNLRATPIFIDGVLYAPNAVGLVEAFDPATGTTLWVQEPTEGGLQGVTGQSTRGVASWRDGSDQRLFSTRGEYLGYIRVSQIA